MRHWQAFFIFVLLYNCQNNPSTSDKTFSVLPSNPLVVLESSNYSNIEASLEELNLLTPLEPSFNRRLKTLFINADLNGNLVIGIYQNADSLNFVISHKALNLSGSKDSTSKTAPKAPVSITPKMLKIESETFYKNKKDNYELYSDSEALLTGEDFFTEHSVLKNINKTESIFSGVNIYGNDTSRFLSLFSKSLKDSTKSKNYIQSHKEANLFQLSGVIQFTDSSSLLNSFKGTTAQPIEISKIIPGNTKHLVSISFDSLNTFLRNRQKDSTLFSSDTISDYLKNAREVSLFKTPEFSGLGIRVSDPSIFESIYQNNTAVESYKDFQLYDYGTAAIYKTMFLPYLSFEKANYFCIIESSILFAESTDNLKQLITAYLNKNTLAKTGSYPGLNSFLLQTSSLLTFWDAAYLKTKFPRLSQDYNSGGFQMTIEEDYFHFNGVLKNYSQQKSKAAVKERFSIDFNQDILVGPQLVSNHLNGTKDILVQDIQNNLILISNNGKIFWTKQLDGKILGEVQQIDMYKNGRLQLAFSTSNKLYVLDRNGNDVKPFPLTFKDKITQPLSVFDYDNTKSYRLLLTQGSDLLMYDARGKRVTGFKYSSNKQEIRSQPKHIRISRKDYIVFKTIDKLKILNRQGKSRLSVNTTINFSDNDIYRYQNQFSTTTAEGALIQVNTKGRLTQQNMNLPKDHFLETTNKTLVTQTENTLSIKLKKLDLDYGNYTRPKIFYLRDKIYITTTDRQSKKAYLFDSQGKHISGFPIFGISQIALGNLDKTTNLEVIILNTSKSLSVFDLK